MRLNNYYTCKEADIKTFFYNLSVIIGIATLSRMFGNTTKHALFIGRNQSVMPAESTAQNAKNSQNKILMRP